MSGICTPCLNEHGSNAWINSKPAFKDLDNDGDYDLILNHYYYENIGDSVTANFIERTGTDNPINIPADAIYIRNVVPALEDMDGDGDFDLFLGIGALSYDISGRGQHIVYFENVGDQVAPNFIERKELHAPMVGVNVAACSQAMGSAALALKDIDQDGDFDMFVGECSGSILYFENVGNSTFPIFVERTGEKNPMNTFKLSNLHTTPEPTLADYDGDGDFDMFVGGGDGGDGGSGTIAYLENTGSSTNSAFTVRTGNQNPMDGFNVRYSASPEIIDFDKDGDFDIVVGSWDNTDGKVHYFENVHGTASGTTQLLYTPMTDSRNPLNEIIIASTLGHENASPIFVDIDYDGGK